MIGLYPVIELGVVKINVFPLVMLFAIFLCLLYFVKSYKYDLSYYEVVIRGMAFAMLFAVIGGKVLFAITQIGAEGFSVINHLLLGGFVFYGGLIGALIGLKVFCTIFKENYFELLDVFASILPLGQAVGRLGCYLNGCCYGKEYQGVFAVSYMVDGKLVNVFPTWFAESIFCFLLFGLFFIISKRHNSGFYTSVYMMYYSFFRFIIEFFRGDDIRGAWGLLSTSQILSILVMIGGILVAIYSHHKKNQNKMFEERNLRYAD